jgi:hypothetical protein
MTAKPEIISTQSNPSSRPDRPWHRQLRRLRPKRLHPDLHDALGGEGRPDLMHRALATYVDHTEHDVQVIVTEQGLADLRCDPAPIVNHVPAPDRPNQLGFVSPSWSVGGN